MRDAGVKRIDNLLMTHFHKDNVANTRDAFNAYAGVRARGAHLQPKPGDRLPIAGVDVTVVSSAAPVIQKPLPAAGGENDACRALVRPSEEPRDNARSTGVVVDFGRFRFLDVGDLLGQPLYDLVCPRARIGAVDVYLVAHHGGADPSTFASLHAFKPRVAVLNNGLTKGASAEAFAALREVRADVWQLDRSAKPGVLNFADEQIANLDGRTGHWIKLIARQDGSFTITNGRTGVAKHYTATSASPPGVRSAQ